MGNYDKCLSTGIKKNKINNAIIISGQKVLHKIILHLNSLITENQFNTVFVRTNINLLVTSQQKYCL